ncbi:MAG: hypothetical protein SH818_13185 [Saprospiraceae bacterium]|nr:hypothetical protein [Saprospiraceae bacterium]
MKRSFNFIRSFFMPNRKQFLLLYLFSPGIVHKFSCLNFVKPIKMKSLFIGIFLLSIQAVLADSSLDY